MPCYVRRKSTPIDALDTGTALLIALGVIGGAGLIAFLVFKPKKKKPQLTDEQKARLEAIYQEYLKRKEKPGAIEWLKGVLSAVKIGTDIWKGFIELKSQQAPKVQTTPTAPIVSPETPKFA